MNNKEDLENVKRLLIVIDMVNGFVKEGALASPSIQRIIPEIVELARVYDNDLESKIAFIRDSHSNNAEEFKVFGEHCIAGTTESELIGELKDFENGNLTYYKNSTNFVFAPNFMGDIAKMHNLENIVLCGCLTDFCVKNGGITLRNLFDQQDRSVTIYFDEAGVDTFDAPGHDRDIVNENSMKDMEGNGLVRVKSIGGIR